MEPRGDGRVSRGRGGEGGRRRPLCGGPNSAPSDAPRYGHGRGGVGSAAVCGARPTACTTRPYGAQSRRRRRSGNPSLQQHHSSGALSSPTGALHAGVGTRGGRCARGLDGGTGGTGIAGCGAGRGRGWRRRSRPVFRGGPSAPSVQVRLHRPPCAFRYVQSVGGVTLTVYLGLVSSAEEHCSDLGGGISFVLLTPGQLRLPSLDRRLVIIGHRPVPALHSPSGLKPSTS